MAMEQRLYGRKEQMALGFCPPLSTKEVMS